jgi:hypothetical protein
VLVLVVVLVLDLLGLCGEKQSDSAGNDFVRPLRSRDVCDLEDEHEYGDNPFRNSL